MNQSDFVIKVEFDSDGGTVSLGAEGELFISPGEDHDSVQLDASKLNLIRLLQQAEEDALEEEGVN